MTPELDPVLAELAHYAVAAPAPRPAAMETARLDLMDSLGCAIRALADPDCRRHVGPLVPGMTSTPGVRLPGTNLTLDPFSAARSLGSMIRWLDYNDTWLAMEWGHPSDNLGGLFALADWLSQVRRQQKEPPLTVGALLEAMVRAHEVQGVLSLETSLNRSGHDHVLFVTVATAAAAIGLMGGGFDQAVSAISNAFLDGGPLRTYRHGTSTGWRKSWAAGEATAWGMWRALLAMRGEEGYGQALSAPGWGFQDAALGGRPVLLGRPLGSFVMEHVLFKVAFPAEFHGQTAVEAALRLHPHVAPRLDQVAEVRIDTQEPALRIIHKTGPLRGPADRDHCLQYMVAVALIYGHLRPEDYRNPVAADPRIDALRARTVVREEPRYSRDYLDPERRSIANAVQVRFADGSATPKVEVEFPLGHPRRRQEAREPLRRKFLEGVAPVLGQARAEELAQLVMEGEELEEMPVDRFAQLWLPPAEGSPA